MTAIPARSNLPAAQSSPLILRKTDLNRFHTDATEAERELYEQAVACLRPIQQPSMSYADMIVFQAKHRVRYLGFVRKSVWYLPDDLPDHTIIDFARELMPRATQPDAVKAALNQLYLTTKHARLSDQDRETMLQTYLNGMLAYPDHAIRLALSHLAADNEFFPPWSEVRDSLHAILGWRADLLVALRNFIRKRKA